MRLVVLGSAGSFPAADNAASGYLVQAEDRDGRTWTVLLELGNGALGPLQRYGDPTALDAIAVSHLHSDHVADLVVLNVLRRYRPQGPCARVPLHGPVGTAERLASMAGKDPATEVDGQYDIREWDPAAPVVVGPITMTPVAVDHPWPTFGVRFTGPAEGDPDRTVTLAYSADTDECPGLDDLATGADLFLCEAAYVEGRDDASRGIHLTGKRAGEAAARGGSGRLLLTHMPTWTSPVVAVAEARGAYDGPVDVALPGAVHVL